MGAELETLAYEAAQRGLDKQDEVLRDVRARTGTLLGASSIAASLLATRVLDGTTPSFLVAAALGAFSVTILASVYILVPQRDQFVFSLAGGVLYEALYGFKDDPGEIYRQLAYQLDRFWDGNDRIIARLFRAYRVAAVALVFEILLVVGVATGILT